MDIQRRAREYVLDTYPSAYGTRWFDILVDTYVVAYRRGQVNSE